MSLVTAETTAVVGDGRAGIGVILYFGAGEQEQIARRATNADEMLAHVEAATLALESLDHFSSVRLITTCHALFAAMKTSQGKESGWEWTALRRAVFRHNVHWDFRSELPKAQTLARRSNAND